MKIKIQGGFGSKVTIEISDGDSEPDYKKDAEKICKILIGEIPSGTYEFVNEFMKKFNNSKNRLWIDENFKKYWEKKRNK